MQTYVYYDEITGNIKRIVKCNSKRVPPALSGEKITTVSTDNVRTPLCPAGTISNDPSFGSRTHTVNTDTGLVVAKKVPGSLPKQIHKRRG